MHSGTSSNQIGFDGLLDAIDFILNQPGEIKFRNSAHEIQSLTDHEWIIHGPAETGKTFAALHRLDALLRGHAKAKAAIVRKVRADMDSTVLNTWRRIIDMHGDVTSFGGEHPEWYQYPNGSRCYIAGLDRPGKVLSGELDWIYVNQAEELTLTDWETLSTRCTGRGGVSDCPMLFGDCNPSYEKHWIRSRKGLKLLPSKHTDNPSLYDDAGNLTDQGKRSMAVLDLLTGVRLQRLRYGVWCSAEGMVFTNWDESKRIIPMLDMQRIGFYQKVMVVDFGFAVGHSFCCQWWVHIPESVHIETRGHHLYGPCWVRYREIYHTGRTVSDHAKQIIALCRADGMTPIAWCDHDPEGIEQLRRAGIQGRMASKPTVVNGIQLIQDAFARDQVFFCEGALVEKDPELVKAGLPTCTEEEIPQAEWATDKEGSIKKEDFKSGVADHGIKNIAYLLQSTTIKQATATPNR